jgi:divalent metal cation (Fe/Co/Zn/Cd) transporter
MRADAELDVEPSTSLTDAHALAHHAEAELVRTVPKLTAAVVHAYPAHPGRQAPTDHGHNHDLGHDHVH